MTYENGVVFDIDKVKVNDLHHWSVGKIVKWSYKKN